MKTCIYCNRRKYNSEFSFEHIWPDALGGDYLPALWKTNNVCRTCNNTSGLFVDGEFLKTWLGQAERSHGWDEYVSLSNPDRATPPLSYMGRLKTSPQEMNVEVWFGPCGAHIVHFRPKEPNSDFDLYAGGNPRHSKEPSRAGRAYLTLTTHTEFWIRVTVSAYKAHFPKAELYATNCQFLDTEVGITTLDWDNPTYPEDITALSDIIQASKEGRNIKAQAAIKIDFESRLLAKLALGIGYNLFGKPLIQSEYADKLRKAMWEADSQKRAQIYIQGAGYAHNLGLGGAEKILAWPAGWVLILKVVEDKLNLIIVTPSEKVVSIVVAASLDKWPQIKNDYEDGWVWLVVLPLGRATEAISLPEYLAHRTQAIEAQSLKEIEGMRNCRDDLPDC